MTQADDWTPKTPIKLAGSVGKDGLNGIADVIAVEIHLNLFITTGNLPGVKTGLFTIGQMTPAFIDAIKAFQKQIAGMSFPDGRVDPNGKTSKWLNGPLTARKGKVNPGKKVDDPPGSVTDARAKIASHARALLAEGGHFLIAAKGDMPGRANGHPVRPAFVNPITLLRSGSAPKLGPAVNAAWLSTGKFGVLGCMGRPTAKKIPDDVITAGTPRMKLVEDYVACVERMRKAGVPVTRWPGFDVYEKKAAQFTTALTRDALLALCPADNRKGVFPRRVSPGSDVQLGEGCADIRHYDCIGFVDFVLARVLSPKWSQSMEFYMKDSTKFDVTDVGPGGKDVRTLAQEGDLVFKDPSDNHCGICARVDGEIKVINCRSMGQGLIKSTLTSEWRFLARLINV